MKNSDELIENNKSIRKNDGNASNWKYVYFLNKHKMLKISAETYKNCIH